MLLIKGTAAGVLLAAQLIPAWCFNDRAVFGVYTYVLSVLNVMTFVVAWGTDRFCLKSVSLWRKNNEGGEEIGGKLFGTYAVIAINMIFATMFLSYYLELKLKDTFSFSILATACVVLFARSIARISSSVTKGLDSVIFSEFVFSLLRPVFFVAFSGILFLVTEKQTVPQFLCLYGIAFLFVFVITAFRNYQTEETRIKVAPNQIPMTYKVSFFFFLIGIGVPVMGNINSIQLGNIRNMDEVGLYNASARIVSLVLLGLVSANLLISPKLSPLFEKGDFDGIRRLVRGNNAFVAALTALPVIIIVLFAEALLGMFGPDYVEAAPILRLLIIGQSVSACCGPVVLTATLCGMQKFAAVVVLSACFINYLFCILLIPDYGPIGAAWASIIGVVLTNITLAFIIYFKTGVDVTMLNLLKK